SSNEVAGLAAHLSQCPLLLPLLASEQRQRQLEGRAAAFGVAVCVDRPIMRLDDRADDRQAETGAGDLQALHVLAAEEALEEAGAILWRDSRAAVGDREDGFL